MSPQPNRFQPPNRGTIVADGYAETTMQILALDYLAEKITSTPTTLTSDAWLGLGVK